MAAPERVGPESRERRGAKGSRSQVLLHQPHLLGPCTCGRGACWPEGSPEMRQRAGHHDLHGREMGRPFPEAEGAGSTQDCNSQIHPLVGGVTPTGVPTPTPRLTTQVPGR